MINRYFIEECDKLIRTLEELKRGSVISPTFKDKLEKDIIVLNDKINYFLNKEVRIKEFKK